MAFYTYLWLREDGIPYYVGKGHGNRAFDWRRRIGSAPARNRIIIQEHLSEEDAFAAEVFLIAFYGRKDLKEGCLINLTNGGEGPAGQKMSPEWCERNRQRVKNTPRRKLTLEECQHISRKLTGRKMSAEFCEKNRRRMLENNPFKGRKHTEESLRIMSEKSRARFNTPHGFAAASAAGKKGAAARWGKR